jgi:hypothetical protein
LRPSPSWIIAFIGALLLLLLPWLVRRTIKFRGLWMTASEYLTLQDLETALEYIDDNPLLLTPGAEYLISTLLDRAWAQGDAAQYVAGVLRLSLLAGCRQFGVKAARQMSANSFQAQLDVINDPSGQRALKLLGQLVTNKGMSIPEQEVNEELLEAMSRIMDLLRPLAANEETVGTMDAILDRLHEILQQRVRTIR